MLRPFRPLRPYLARYKARFVAGFLCLLVSQLVGVIVPLIIKSGIDELMQGHGEKTAWGGRATPGGGRV